MYKLIQYSQKSWCICNSQIHNLIIIHKIQIDHAHQIYIKKYIIQFINIQICLHISECFYMYKLIDASAFANRSVCGLQMWVFKKHNFT